MTVAIEQPAIDPVVSNRADLEHRRQTLYQRLEDGYQRIEAAIREGQDVTRWEDFWVQLLEEYETVCDTLHAEGR